MSDPENNIASSFVSYIYDKCPLCERIGKSLACVQCTKEQKEGFLIYQQGEIHTNKSNIVRVMFISRDLEEKLAEFQEYTNDLQTFKLKASENIKKSPATKTSQLKSDINNSKTCIADLRLILKNQQLEVIKKKKQLHGIQKTSTSAQKRINRSSEKKVKLKEHIKAKKGYIEKLRQKKDIGEKELLKRKKIHVTLLREYIFPINEVKEDNIYTGMVESLEADESDHEKTLMQEELDEARRMSFVNGRWVDQQVGSSDIFQISVVTRAASAPSDGDYSSYVKWLEENHTSPASDLPVSGASMSTSTDIGVQSPLNSSVFRISAALSHASQMLMVMRKILGVHLPYRINYKTFCNPTISPHVFINAVKLLNCNVLSMCLLQGVDGSALHPLHTLRNLQILAEKLLNEVERQHLVVPEIEVLLSMEETLGLADVSDDESDEDQDVLDCDSDWQAVAVASRDFNR